MLSHSEKFGCKQIMSLLTDEDISALVGTSTGHAIKVGSRSEAENAILAFTESAEELLNRRKISKELLLNYCRNAFIPVSASVSKGVVVTAIIKHWALTTTETPAAFSASAGQRERNVSSGLAYQHNSNQSSSSGYQQVAPNNQHLIIVQNVVNFQSPHVSKMAGSVDADQSSAEAFVKWFFEMLNAYHPALNKPSEIFGPQHFWDNVQLFLLMVTTAEKKEENIVGSDRVAERLLSFPKSSHILFNPNVSSQGVTVRSSCHGSKIILVCGTLHTASECCGIFQQSFALVSNPLSPGKWKVKVMCLKMDQCPASNLPKLENCQEIQAIEAHTTLALEQSEVDRPV